MRLLLTLALLTTQAQAGPETQCFGCHGVDGISFSDTIPNLAGQKNGYLLRQMLDFKSGERKGTVMPALAKGLTAEQMRQISKYYSERGQCE